MNVYRPNISLRTFLKTRVKYLKVKKTGSFLRSGNCRSCVVALNYTFSQVSQFKHIVISN